MLDVRNLTICFDTLEGTAHVVNGVEFRMAAGEIRALVGESGSGKSLTGLALLGLIPTSNGRLTHGSIDFEGTDLARLDQRGFRNIRGRRIAMIFQNPMSALDPSFTIGNQLIESIRFHQKLTRTAARARAAEVLTQVGIRDLERVLNAYPHALSGGMRQRIMIALAISCEPDLLIADEPTTALDATIQRQILDLLKRINQDIGTAILMITHDFGVVARLCQTVSVMYAGRVVESGSVADVLSMPEHPYTRALIRSLPHRRNWIERDGLRRLRQIDGTPPNPVNLPTGCAFADRCPEVQPICRSEQPARRDLRTGQAVSCHQRRAEEQP